MSLDRGFLKWLSQRGLQPTTVAILRKESILHEATLKLLTHADLELLRTKHHMSMGQFVLLRTAHGDLLEADEEGFEMVAMDEVPADLGIAGRSGSQARASGSRRASREENYRVQEKKQSTRDLLSDNLAKAARRERKLQSVADISERVLSSADEYSQLATQLAAKKRREAGKGFFGQRSSSSSSVETGSRASVKRPSSTTQPDYDHLDKFSPPPSQPLMNHVQLESGRSSESGSAVVRQRRDRDSNGYRQHQHNSSSTGSKQEEDSDINDCCTIL